MIDFIDKHYVYIYMFIYIYLYIRIYIYKSNFIGYI